jgi:hypothetical protein
MVSENKTKKENKIPPKIHGNLGRSPIDWTQLYHMWLKSGMAKPEFLDQFGLSLKSSKVKGMIAAWSRDERTTATKMQNLMGVTQGPVSDSHVASLWQVVQQWRAGQAESDFKTADMIRAHVKLILNQGFIKDADGNVQSKLSPNQINSLADSLAIIQKVQRLALGMSTENVGVDRPVDTHIEQPTGSDSDIPVFVVEINDAGKFVRPRPKLVNGA